MEQLTISPNADKHENTYPWLPFIFDFLGAIALLIGGVRFAFMLAGTPDNALVVSAFVGAGLFYLAIGRALGL